MTTYSISILLVEDDPVLGPLTQEALTECGHDSVLSVSAVDAFRMLSAPNAFNVVLLDLQLGKDRGEALIQRLRNARTILPAIVILSAQPMSELAYAARAIDAAAILQKPCTLQKIVDTVEQVAA